MSSANPSPTIDKNALGCVEIKDVDEETISDSFVCCVCLDLLFKPIVLECGHVSCFWCVHKSMDGLRESHCPICRHPYHHFPTICEMLHFLLLKLYPVAYKRREKQIIEDEKEMGFFSPQLDCEWLGSIDGCKSSHDASTFANMPCASGGKDDCSKVDSNISVAIKQNNFSAINYDRTCDRVSSADVLCPACKQLLFRPAVLNCGHVFCEACITVPEDGIIMCKVCESPHPSDFPNVCLEFNNFLEEKFPEEYAARRENVEEKQSQFQHKSSLGCSNSKKSAKNDVAKSFYSSGDFLPWWNEHGSKVHMGAGCDNCGMYPIVGDRYRCQDCVELIGFDLCGDCYNTRSKRPGRFNQQHTPDHRFELVKQPDFLRNIMSRLVGGHLVDSSGAPVLAISALEDSLDGWIAVESGDAPQHTDSNLVVPDGADIMHNRDDGEDATEVTGGSVDSPAHHNDNIEQGNNPPSTA